MPAARLRLPEQREAEHQATESTIDANGGRNSAG
ncbi:hypothetical protein STANM309S_00047 [Streptomyces tanashiensis]